MQATILQGFTKASQVPRKVSQTLGRRVGRHRTRSGVSLLEVTFSIGVVMVGLLGVAALLPVAGSLANKGMVADSAARRGSDAVREFRVRSMGNWSTWRWFDTSVGQFRPAMLADLTAGRSFCLDPRFVAQGNDSADHAARNGFPYLDDLYPGVILSMRRITLWPGPSNPPLPATAIMGRLQADQVFTSSDDLVFDLPRDRTLGPVQNFSRWPSDLDPPLRRNNNGNISWLATLVPKLDRMGNLTDAYTLSVVVFSRRVIDRTLTDEDLASERVVVVNQFYSGQPAAGGGDLRLATRRNNRDDLELRSGDWVMLSGTKLRPAMPPIQVHNWYRVSNAGEGPTFDSSNNVWFREATLSGPDWDWGHMANNTPTQYLTPTQVTIVRGAVALFEKTVRLESSSLWTN